MRYKSNFYDAILEYGIENFIWETIDECSDDILNEREIFWISEYRKSGKCYNIQDGGQNSIGKYNCKIGVDAYLDNGEFFGSFSSLHEASLNTNAKCSAISCCINKKRMSAGKYNGMRILWCKSGASVNIPKKWKCGIRVNAYTECGNFIKTFDTMIEGAEFFGLKSYGGIYISIKSHDKQRYSGILNGKRIMWERFK